MIQRFSVGKVVLQTMVAWFIAVGVVLVVYGAARVLLAIMYP